jgi:hypothetical protein
MNSGSKTEIDYIVLAVKTEGLNYEVQIRFREQSLFYEKIDDSGYKNGANDHDAKSKKDSDYTENSPTGSNTPIKNPVLLHKIQNESEIYNQLVILAKLGVISIFVFLILLYIRYKMLKKKLKNLQI